MLLWLQLKCDKRKWKDGKMKKMGSGGSEEGSGGGGTQIYSASYCGSLSERAWKFRYWFTPSPATSSFVDRWGTSNEAALSGIRSSLHLRLQAELQLEWEAMTSLYLAHGNEEPLSQHCQQFSDEEKNISCVPLLCPCNCEQTASVNVRSSLRLLPLPFLSTQTESRHHLPYHFVS